MNYQSLLDTLLGFFCFILVVSAFPVGMTIIAYKRGYPRGIYTMFGFLLGPGIILLGILIASITNSSFGAFLIFASGILGILLLIIAPFIPKKPEPQPEVTLPMPLPPGTRDWGDKQ